MRRPRLNLLLLPLLFMTGALGGCGQFGSVANLSDRECLARAMYFESNRSSEDGMLAVGTTVMNRVAAPNYPKTVCGVVGQRNQYAEGVLSHPMDSRARARSEYVADKVLSGERHPQVGSAMFFHTAGLTFPYSNMHYVAVAGGNAFYEKLPMRSNAYFRSPAPMSSSMVFARAKPTTLFDVLKTALSPAPVRQRRVKVASVAYPYEPKH